MTTARLVSLSALSALAALFALAFGAPARADVPPLDACSQVGVACTLPNGQPGTCAESTCSRPDYASRGGDGPMQFMEYACNRCVAADGQPVRQGVRPPVEADAPSDEDVAPAADEPDSPPPAEPVEQAPSAEPADPAPSTEAAPAATVQPEPESSLCAAAPGRRDPVALGLVLLGLALLAGRRVGRGGAARRGLRIRPRTR